MAGLAFIAISFVLGAYLRGPFGALVNGDLPGHSGATTPSCSAMRLLFPILLAVLHVVAHPFLKDKHMRGMTRELDKALGAIFGFIEGVLILSVAGRHFRHLLRHGLERSARRPAWASCPGLVASFNESYTVHLLRDTTVPMVLAVLGPLLPKDISTPHPGWRAGHARVAGRRR